MRIRNKLRAWRTKQRLTLREAAELLGFKSWGHLRDIETGKRRITGTVAERIAQALDMPARDIETFAKYEWERETR